MTVARRLERRLGVRASSEPGERSLTQREPQLGLLGPAEELARALLALPCQTGVCAHRRRGLWEFGAGQAGVLQAEIRRER